MLHVETIDPFVTRSHWLIGARTLLVDRAVPAFERMFLPPARSPGGTVTVRDDPRGRFPSTRTGLRALRHAFRPDRRPDALTGPIVDMRANSPQNFSHCLVIHLPQCEIARSVLRSSFTVVLPYNTPRYIRDVFKLADLPVVSTDHDVAGETVSVEFSELEALKGGVGAIVRQLAERMRTSHASSTPLPKKAFVARRGSRAITNQREIEEVLAARGYATLYAEDLAVADQFRLFDEADEIVGVHGAGLAPILYRSVDRPPLRLVEILPASHMTNLHRFFVDAVGGRYVGVRGRISKNDAAAAYGSAMYMHNSLDNFEVDPQSVVLALEIMEDLS